MALSSRSLITKTGISTTQVFDMGGINISGGDFNLGSNIKLGNASGIITSTNFKTGSSNLHSAGVEVAGVNVLGADTPIGTGATIFNDGSVRFGHTGNNNTGIVTANKFIGDGSGLTGLPAGNLTGTVADARISSLTASKLTGALPALDGSNLTGITQTTINNNANNRLITGSGTANTLEGEANLTFDGNDLTVTGTAPAINFIDTDADDYKIHNVQGLLKVTDTTASADRLVINDNGTGYFLSNFQIGSTTTSPGATLHLKTSYPSLKVDSGGHASDAYVRIIAGNAQNSRVDFGDSDDDDIGMIDYDHANNSMRFLTNTSERLRIDGNGKVGVGGAPSGWQAADTSKVVQIGNASIFNYNDAYFHVGQNFYYDGSNYKYVANGFSSRLIQNAGEFTFIQAASGSANANITWSDRLKIDTTGRITQNGTTSADTASALTLKNGQSGNDHTILELISDPNQYSMIYMGASDDRYKGRIRYKDNDHFMDFYTNNEQRMKIWSTGRVGINTDSTSVDARLHVVDTPGVPGLYSSYGMRVMPNGNSDKRISNATGVYALTAGITANNTWHTVAIGRYHAATVTMRVGDASSKRSIFFNYDLTAPNYGVAHLNVIANNGAWNTGGADVQLSSSGSSDYAIQVKHTSYYNTSNTSGVYMIFNVA